MSKVEVGDSVRVTEIAEGWSSDLLGRAGELLDTDLSDPSLRFLVRVPGSTSGTAWVRSVDLAEVSR
jgi:hypothetical protein